MKAHLTKCEGQITREHVNILGTTTKSEIHLKTLEALWIREYKAYLNTQDTMKSRYLKLTINGKRSVTQPVHWQESCCVDNFIQKKEEKKEAER